MENKESEVYSTMICSVFKGIKESIAIKKLKDTTDTLNSLGYNKGEIKEIIGNVLNQVSYN